MEKPKDFTAKVNASTALTAADALKAKLHESLDLQTLIDEHNWDCLPNISSLNWEGHARPLPSVILVDMDHTIAHSSWRDSMIGSAPWDEYHRWGCHDRPVAELCALLSDLGKNSHWEMVGITGRPEAFRQMTMNWLIKHGVYLDDLMMRDNDDYRPNAQMKVEMAKERWGEPLSDHVAFIIDDNEEVCSAFKAECITTLQVSIRRHD